MGFFDFLKKPDHAKQASPELQDAPYADAGINFIYQILFCDDISLYKDKSVPPYDYPFSVIFSDESTLSGLQKIVDDKSLEPRIRMLAYQRMRQEGYAVKGRELLAVIVEVGLPEGLDVLASFASGTARYINASGKLLVWENADDATGKELTEQLFAQSKTIVEQIGLWNDKRKPHPVQGNTRISFLASDGLYFGEAPTGILFGDKLAGPALLTATKLLQYITDKALEEGSQL